MSASGPEPEMLCYIMRGVFKASCFKWLEKSTLHTNIHSVVDWRDKHGRHLMRPEMENETNSSCIHRKMLRWPVMLIVQHPGELSLSPWTGWISSFCPKTESMTDDFSQLKRWDCIRKGHFWLKLLQKQQSWKVDLDLMSLICHRTVKMLSHRHWGNMRTSHWTSWHSLFTVLHTVNVYDSVLHSFWAELKWMMLNHQIKGAKQLQHSAWSALFPVQVNESQCGV